MTRRRARFGTVLRMTVAAGLLASLPCMGGSASAQERAENGTATYDGKVPADMPPTFPKGPPTVAQLDPASQDHEAGDPLAGNILARGKYLTDLADCASCHTHAGGPEFAGGRPMGMPFGTIFTPNITPDKQTGIGLYTEADMERLFRRGVNRVGQHVYPGMPYPWYASMRGDDIKAIYAYLMSQAPVRYKIPENKVFFPFTLRPAIALWNALFVPSGVFHDRPDQPALVNRGEYIVDTFAHCSECHNGRTLLGKGDIALPLQGGVITHWATPNITNDKTQGLGRYSDQSLFNYLKDGADDVMGTVVGPMRETVDVSLSKLRDDDIRAIIAYLRTQDRPATYSSYRRDAYKVANPHGSSTYFSFCASCHGVDGRGETGKIPALDGNGMVRASGPHNIINVIIGGIQARGSFGVMPALGDGMTDQQIADVSNFVRQAWSNGAPPNATAFLVKMDRAHADGAKGDLLNGMHPGGCPSLDLPPLQAAVHDPASGIVQSLKAMTLPTMLQTVDDVIGKVKKAAPGLKQAEIVNGLTILYCPIVSADPTLSPRAQALQLDNFATRVYTQLTTNGAY